MTVLLVIALGLLYWLWRRWQDPRLAWLSAAVSFGLLVVAITELLSAAVALRPELVACSWGAVDGTLAWLAWRARKTPAMGSPIQFTSRFARWVSASIALLSLFLLAAALASAPNTFDVLTYHMTRVVYWAQHQTVAFFPVNDFQLLFQAPWTEYTYLHLYLLSGGDTWTNLVQWTAWVSCAVAASRLALELGAESRGQALAAVLAAAVPQGILEASGAKNDVVVAFWCVTGLVMLWNYIRLPLWWTGLLLGGSIGLALFTKGTAYVLLPGLLLPFLPRLPRRFVPLLLAGVAILVVTGPQYVRNMRLLGSPIAPRTEVPGAWPLANERITPGTLASNAVRNASLHLASPSAGWNRSVESAVVSLERRLGQDANDPATTWANLRYSLSELALGEATAANVVPFLLLVSGSVIVLLRILTGPSPQGDAARLWLGIVLAAMTFCLTLKWQPWHTRLHYPLFIAGAAAFGASIVPRLSPRVSGALGVLLLLSALPYALVNRIRPVVGPQSVLSNPRADTLFYDIGGNRARDFYYEVIDHVARTGCRQVSLDTNYLRVPYVLMRSLRQRDPRFRFDEGWVGNSSARFAGNVPAISPCAVICVDCAGHPDVLEHYSAVGPAKYFDKFVVLGPGPQ